jgi:hypothetical protein
MRHEQALSHVAPIEVPQPPHFSGTWKNQLGSTMHLEVTGSKLTGKYKSAVSGKDKPIEGELSGYVNGDLIAFVVNWPTPAITAWVGQLVSDGGTDVIETLWHLISDVEDPKEPTGLWRSVLAGTDRFRR